MPKKKKLIYPLIIWALSLFTLPGNSLTADQNQEETREGEERLLFLGEDLTIITAVRREQKVSEAPASVTVITRREIEQSGALSLPELLVGIPGMDFLRKSEENVEVSIRGFNNYSSNKILVLLDERPLYDIASTTVKWNLIPVSLDDIERIEIVRGPGSALYGANAFLGIINIITRPNGAGSPESEGKAEVFSLSLGYGIHNTFFTAVNSQGMTERVAYLLYAGINKYDRFKEEETEISNPFVSELGVKLKCVESDLKKAFFKISYDPSFNTTLTLSAGHAYLENLSRTTNEAENSTFLSFILGARPRGTDLNIRLSADWGDADIIESDVSPSTTLVREALRSELELRHTLKPFPNDYLTYGANITFHSIEDGYFLPRDYEQTFYGIYLQNEITLFKRLDLITGLRFDKFPDFSALISPRANLVYQLGKGHTLRAGYGRAYRSPTLFDLHSYNPTGKVLITGNPDLDPEKIQSYEVGYEYRTQSAFIGKLDLFNNEIKDLITLKELLTAEGNRAFSPVNRDKARALGGEIELRYRPKDFLSGFTNYSYQEVRFLGEKDIHDEVPFSPKHKVNLGITVQKERNFSLMLSGHYVGDQVMTDTNAPLVNRAWFKGYTTASLKISKYFFERALEISFNYDNILGQAHFESPLHCPVGGAWMLKVKGSL
ncbi:MAG: TonB-dependent receptor [Deltaproteobacteria bacterium]|nr:MAG: TonB-dependent receptor [Deltaproteobacteria bacterium]